MSSFEKISGSATEKTTTSKKSASKDKIVKFAEEEFSDDLIGEEEIPF